MSVSVDIVPQIWLLSNVIWSKVQVDSSRRWRRHLTTASKARCGKRWAARRLPADSRTATGSCGGSADCCWGSSSSAGCYQPPAGASSASRTGGTALLGTWSSRTWGSPWRGTASGSWRRVREGGAVERGVAGRARRGGRCSAVGGGCGRSGASEQVLLPPVRRSRLDRLLAQLRH